MGESMELRPIGTVGRKDGKAFLRIDAPYRAGLAGLEEFSHCAVFWWAGFDFGFDGRGVLESELPYAPGHRAGVFACRGPFRPNPVCVTVCEVKHVDMKKGILEVGNIDAFDDTVVVDIKAYYGCTDRVRECSTPAWLPDWGEWIPEEGIGLED